MIAPTTAIRVTARSDWAGHPRGAPLLLACAGLEALAVGLLLFGAPLSLWIVGPVAAVSHGAAVLLLFGLARSRPSCRWLCVAAVLAVPLVGVAVPAAVLATRERGPSATRRRRNVRRRPALTMTEMRRLGGALSPCDALDGDEEQRRIALSALSRRGDPEAIALLRWAAAGRDPDLALSAALVLDEIGERAEHRVDRLDPAELRRVVG